MIEEKSIVIFQNKKIRRTWFNDEWWFVAVDIIEALTDSKDPAHYLKDMRRRDEGFKQGWGQIATPLVMRKNMQFPTRVRVKNLQWSFSCWIVPHPPGTLFFFLDLFECPAFKWQRSEQYSETKFRKHYKKYLIQYP